MSSKPDSIEQKITEWIEGQGYPLELTTASAFQKAGFNISSSDYYTDFETNDSREIDVIATSSFVLKDVYLELSCHIECKSAKDKPWIIFRIDNDTRRPLPTFVNMVCSRYYTAFLSQKREEFARFEFTKAFMSPNHIIGHGITQAFTTGMDMPYKAVMSTVKSAIDHTKWSDEALERRRYTPGIYHTISVAIPIIIIDGRLFEYVHTSSDEKLLYEVEHGVIRWKGRNPLRISPIIHVATKTYLEKLTQELRTVSKDIYLFTKDNNDAFVEFLAKSLPQVVD